MLFSHKLVVVVLNLHAVGGKCLCILLQICESVVAVWRNYGDGLASHRQILEDERQTAVKVTLDFFAHGEQIDVLQ